MNAAWNLRQTLWNSTTIGYDRKIALGRHFTFAPPPTHPPCTPLSVYLQSWFSFCALSLTSDLKGVDIVPDINWISSTATVLPTINPLAVRLHFILLPLFLTPSPSPFPRCWNTTMWLLYEGVSPGIITIIFVQLNYLADRLHRQMSSLRRRQRGRRWPRRPGRGYLFGEGFVPYKWRYKLEYFRRPIKKWGAIEKYLKRENSVWRSILALIIHTGWNWNCRT